MTRALIEIALIYAAMASVYWLVRNAADLAYRGQSGAIESGKKFIDAALLAFMKIITPRPRLKDGLGDRVMAGPADKGGGDDDNGNGGRRKKAVRDKPKIIRTPPPGAKKKKKGRGKGPKGDKPKSQDGRSGKKAEAKPESRNAKPKVERPLSAQAQLDAMIGLGEAKKQVKEITDLAWLDRERVKAGKKPLMVSRHMVFTGNPGTGKTEVAKLVGRIFFELEFLSKGHMTATNRGGMVGEYVGHTAPKVNKVVTEALGGVLFIDEAYLLAPVNPEKDFGPEAVGTLLEHMENNRDDLIVIAAGYEHEMERFIGSNPGLKSRFANFVHFPDYDEGELYEIFKFQCSEAGFALSEGGKRAAREEIGKIYKARDEHFGNGREMRNLRDRCIRRLGGRVRADSEATQDDLSIITAHDIGEEYDGLESAEDVMPWSAQEEEVALLRKEREELRKRMDELGIEPEEEEEEEGGADDDNGRPPF